MLSSTSFDFHQSFFYNITGRYAESEKVWFYASINRYPVPLIFSAGKYQMGVRYAQDA